MRVRPAVIASREKRSVSAPNDFRPKQQRPIRPRHARGRSRRGLIAADLGAAALAQQVTFMGNDSAVVAFDDKPAAANAGVILPAH
jgi:hypothetical protein